MLEPITLTIESTIAQSALVVIHDLIKMQLSPNSGYLEGQVTFIDNSRLIFFEFRRQTEAGVQREKYRYHFMDDTDQLIFRYDNAPHHPQITTFPDHKHLPTGITESSAPSFTDVFAEIESIVLSIM